MATKDKGNNTAAAEQGDEQWEDVPTAGNLEGEWVPSEHLEGTVITGAVERAFVTNSDEYGLTPAYAIRGMLQMGEMEADGVHIIGEKASFARAFRELPVGSKVRLAFLSKEPILDSRGKKTGKHGWKTSVKVQRSGAKKTLRDLLNEDYATKKTNTDTPF